jgi:hypothetical protein
VLPNFWRQTLQNQQWRRRSPGTIKKETRRNKTKQISTRLFHHNSQNGRWLLFALQGHLTRLHVNKRVDPSSIKNLIFRKQFIWIPESVYFSDDCVSTAANADLCDTATRAENTCFTAKAGAYADY